MVMYSKREDGTMSIFSERITELMTRHGFSQRDLATKAGVTESAMSYYVKGERTPRSDVLTRVANALNTTTDYLLGASNSADMVENELLYLQRNLSKLDPQQLKRAETILKAAFDDIFDDEDEE